MFKWFWTIFSLGAALSSDWLWESYGWIWYFPIKFQQPFCRNKESYYLETGWSLSWLFNGSLLPRVGLSGNNSHKKKNCIACSCSMCLESGSLVRNRGIEKNEWGLGTVVLTHPQRVNVWCTSAREGEGRREGDPRTSRTQNPLFLLFQRADKNRICFSVVVAYSSAYTRKTCHLFFLSPTLFI